MALVLAAESSFETGPATDDSSHVASSSSTPPTTVADTASEHSETPKRDVVHVALEIATHESAIHVASLEPVDADSPAPDNERRSRRARVSAPVYNLAQLSGTAGHGKRRSKGDTVVDRRRTISGDTLLDSTSLSPRSRNAFNSKAVRDGIEALDLQWSLGRLDSPRSRRVKSQPASPATRRTSSRLSGAPVSGLTNSISKLGKRGRKAMDKGKATMSRELRRLQDTKEFAHIDEKPVVHTVWSNGKYVDPNAPEPPTEDEAEPESEEESEAEPEPVTNVKKSRVKKWMDKGLYSGQDSPIDISKGLTVIEKKTLAQLPELIPSGRVNKTMPLPIYTGLRMLIAGRDFKLPYQVCNPLPPGQPKPDEWKKMTKNRFIGESKDYWRKSPHYHDMSKCVCKREDGCGESCQNRIMLYECDQTNCNVGEQYCSNRAFATLTARRARGGKYRVGVEVIKTSDRGYGVRSNRCFKPGQIIMEYAGEIITEEECERRMTEEYKNNDCYYLMSFDQNMIIDATTGSPARFVNHSCNPNCRMIKWIVSGQPRMALFAGDKPIMTGDELTYDYNFDPFSAKNVQKCLCGEPNCRGVLGPKPREVKPPKATLKTAVKATVKAGKRKIKELMGDEADAGASKAKKRKIQPATGVKRTLSSASSKVAKGAATALKKGVSTVTVKKAMQGKTPAHRRASTGALIQKTTAARVIKTYGKGKGSAARARISSTTSSVTLVTVDSKTKATSKKGSPASKASSRKSTPVKKAAANKRSSLTVSATAKATPKVPKAAQSVSQAATPRQAVDVSRGDEICVVTTD